MYVVALPGYIPYFYDLNTELILKCEWALYAYSQHFVCALIIILRLVDVNDCEQQKHSPPTLHGGPLLPIETEQVPHYFSSLNM